MFNFYQENAEEVAAIILDFEMPVMTGIEAAEKIRGYEKSVKRNKIPIIGLTGHDTKAEKEEGRLAGMDIVMTKPIKRNDLLGLLKKYDGARLNDNE